MGILITLYWRRLWTFLFIQVNEDELCTLLISRKCSLGIIRFIGELYKLGAVNTNNIVHILAELLRDGRNQCVEYICCLLNTVGKELTSDLTDNVVDIIFWSMTDMFNSTWDFHEDPSHSFSCRWLANYFCSSTDGWIFPPFGVDCERRKVVGSHSVHIATICISPQGKCLTLPFLTTITYLPQTSVDSIQYIRINPCLTCLSLNSATGFHWDSEDPWTPADKQGTWTCRSARWKTDMIVDWMVSIKNTTSRPTPSPSQVVWTASRFSLNSPELVTWAESSFCHRGSSLIVVFFLPPFNLCLHIIFNSEMLNISTSLGETLKSTKIPSFLFSPKYLILFWRCLYQLHV